MWEGIAITSALVFALVLVWTAIDRTYGGTASGDDDEAPCENRHRCMFCSCGRARSMAQRANGGGE